MKRPIARFLWWCGRLLYFITALSAFVYAVSCVLWLHAPVLRVLLVTALMALPLLGVGWLLKRLGSRMEGRSVRPWFATDPDTGVLRRTDRKND